MRNDENWYRSVKHGERKLKQARKNYYNEKNGRECRTYSATHKAYAGTKLEAKHGGRQQDEDDTTGVLRRADVVAPEEGAAGPV